MKRVILFAIILVLAMATVSWAVLPNTGPRITYGGYVEIVIPGTPNMVTADTLICVFNPNNFVINNVNIAVFDKDGIKVADTKLLDHGAPISSIVAKGWGWQTLGNLISTISPIMATKYTFVVYWTKPTLTPNRGLVIEIKELIYTTAVPANEGPWLPNYIKFWSEAAIGKGGTGFSGN